MIYILYPIILTIYLTIRYFFGRKIIGKEKVFYILLSLFPIIFFFTDLFIFNGFFSDEWPIVTGLTGEFFLWINDILL